MRVTLDRTAFYPEGGGQPWDTGTLGGVPVLEVHSRDGQVVHTCGGPLEPGATVRGTIDWDRRFDLMQQHSGEHIVSGLAHATWGCDNVGFHLGSEVVTIDLNVLLDEGQLAQLEEAANRYLWEDHPVQITYPSPQELERLDYRSKKELTGQVRIVTFPGADCCACCGTHVRSAGQVGLIKLLTVQKFRDGVRIELVCGRRALRYVNQILEQNRRSPTCCPPSPLRPARRWSGCWPRTRGTRPGAPGWRTRASPPWPGSTGAPGTRSSSRRGYPPTPCAACCDAVLHTCGGVLCLFLPARTRGGWQYAVGAPDRDLRPLAKEMNAALEGRGGGKPDFIQGMVRASRARIEAFFRAR